MLYLTYTDIINRIKCGFQDAASPIVEGIHDLHDHIMFFICLIVALVLFMIFDAVYSAYPVKA
jgi:heme/copper-type cytochrome/quinol oxidase subunit 2